jgi:hypothetical protein
LIVAVEDQSDCMVAWSHPETLGGQVAGATGQPGTGSANTDAIITAHTEWVPKRETEYLWGLQKAYTSWILYYWFLPSERGN